MFRASPPSSLAVRRALAACALVALSTPSAAAEPAGGCTPFDAVVVVSWDRDRAATVSGVVTRIRFPAALDVATDPADGSAKGAVELLTGTAGGLFDALVKDSDGDHAGDVLSVGLITSGIGPGSFAKVRFECRPGVAAVATDAVSCTADVADESGSVPSTCTVTRAPR